MDDWPIQPVLSAGKFSSHLGRRIWARKQSIKLKNILVNCIHCNMGQTVEKPRVQPGKAVPREFPRAQPEGTPKGQFFRATRGFSTVSQTLFNPVGQSWTFKTQKACFLTKSCLQTVPREQPGETVGLAAG